jgi:hypothetical protein
MIRARAGISFALTEALDDGHCGLPRDDLLPLAVKLLEIPDTIVLDALRHCLRSQARERDWGKGSADNIRANGRHDPHQQAEDMTAPTIKRNAAKKNP